MEESVIELDNWNSATEEFEKDVKELIEYNVKATFPYIGYDNTSVVAKQLVEHTSKELLIFDNLSSGFISNYSQFVFAINKFCEQGKEISLIVDGNYNEDLASLVEIKNYLHINPDKGSLKIISDDAKELIKKEFKGNYSNFAVADCNKYRLETSKERNESVSSFDDDEKSVRLKNIFKKALELSNPIP